MTARITAVVLLLLVWVAASLRTMPATGQPKPNVPVIANVFQQRLTELLTAPICLQSSEGENLSYEIDTVTFASEGITLTGELHLPLDTPRNPAIVIMHGGGSNYDQIMAAPRYYAHNLAACGFAVLIYDKRGTGQSGEVFHESTYDDFIADAGNAARFLANHDCIDPARIGLYGGSEAGRLGPIVAVRFPIVAAVIAVSGPVGIGAEHSDHNINYAMHLRGYPDSIVDAVMPLWRRHHAAWASRDPDTMRAVADEIIRWRAIYDPNVLPNTESEILTDTNLFFLHPGYNSMRGDFVSELSQLRVPFLALYGELDPIVNVTRSAANLRERMDMGGHEDFEIIIIDSVGHSFVNPATGERTPTVNIMVNWFTEKLAHR